MAVEGATHACCRDYSGITPPVYLELLSNGAPMSARPANIHVLHQHALARTDDADFRKSQEQARRNFIRRTVRSYRGFTKSERDVTLALLSVWFHHKNGVEGYIHPGRRLLASRARVTQKTVQRLLARLRDERVLITVGHLNGGPHMATQYVLNEERLIDMCGGSDWVKRFLRMRAGVR